MWSAAAACRATGFEVLAGPEAPDTSGQVRASETAVTISVARRTGRVYRFISIKQFERRGGTSGTPAGVVEAADRSLDRPSCYLRRELHAPGFAGFFVLVLCSCRISRGGGFVSRAC